MVAKRPWRWRRILRSTLRGRARCRWCRRARASATVAVPEPRSDSDALLQRAAPAVLPSPQRARGARRGPSRRVWRLPRVRTRRLPVGAGGWADPRYLLAAVVAVAVTTLVLHLLGMQHPPAGATTLIVALGILATPVAVLDMLGAVVLITVVGWGLNRLLLGSRR